MTWRFDNEQQVESYLKRRGLSDHSSQKIAQRVSEKDFQAAVKDMALVNGWRFHHHWNSIHSSSGLPDCIFIHSKKRRLIFAELKIDNKQPTQSQQEWLNDLSQLDHGVESYLWYPKDIDQIWQILSK